MQEEKNDIIYPHVPNEYIFIHNNIFPHCEDEIIELKNKNLSDFELSKIFSGFMNHKGGCLYIGISDEKRIIGIKYNNKKIDELKLKMDNVVQKCIYPSTNKIKFNIFPVFTSELDKTQYIIVRVDIQKCEKRICASDGNFYERHLASFRNIGISGFVNKSEYAGLETRYKNVSEENVKLKKEIKELNGKVEEDNSILEEYTLMKIKEHEKNQNISLKNILGSTKNKIGILLNRKK